MGWFKAPWTVQGRIEHSIIICNVNRCRI